MGEYILQTRNLCKDYKKQCALNKLNISVKKNSIYGLLGPNGAGKSTALKLLTGILKPSDGEILFKGDTWKREALNHIGSLIEAPPLYENLTAYENLKVRCILLGLNLNRIDEVLELVKLQDVKSKKVKSFSMGMKQRLGIALALLNKPDLLILDEPTNGLDPMGIQELRHLIKSFAMDGITVIISSHILWEIQQVADVVGIINKGCLLYEGEINEDSDLESKFMEVLSGVEGGITYA